VTVLESTVDPAGRVVELTVERWEHILDPLDGHPELRSFRDQLLKTVRMPDMRLSGREENEEWYFSVASVLANGFRWS
jgi:hypothetical protein